MDVIADIKFVPSLIDEHGRGDKERLVPMVIPHLHPVLGGCGFGGRCRNASVGRFLLGWRCCGLRRWSWSERQQGGHR